MEICLEGGPDTARLDRGLAAVVAGGADRVELCRDLAVEGLTPDAAHVRRARAVLGPGMGLTALVRVRAGDFGHDAGEGAALLDELGACLDAGADEVRLGALRDGAVDVALLARAVDAARSMGARVGFHRAFDALTDPFAGLEQLIEQGVDRILCSGTPWEAVADAAAGAAAGVGRLAALSAAAAGRVELVLAGGITPENAPGLLARVVTPGARLALHAASGVCRDGEVHAGRVARLVAAARSPG